MARLSVLLATIVAVFLLMPAGVAAVAAGVMPSGGSVNEPVVLEHGSDDDGDDDNSGRGGGDDDDRNDDDRDADHSGPGGGGDDDDWDDDDGDVASPGPSAGASAGAPPAGGTGGGAQGGQAATSATVSMAGRAFSPRSVTIAAGGTVTFSNNDDDEHTASATDVAWDSGVLAPGSAFDRRFPAPGSFAFLCLIHPDMQGTVIVQAPGATAGTNAAPAKPKPEATPRPSTATPAPPQPAKPAQRGTVDIAMVDLAFEPAAVEAVVGSTIRWTNEGAAPHTATAEDGTFDSGIVTSGGRFEVVLDTPGTFAYVCQLHPGMAGSVVVAAGARSPTGTGENGPAAAASTGEPSPAPTSAASGPPGASPSPAASASAPPVAVTDPGSGGEAASGPGRTVTAGTAAPARASFDVARLGIVILLVGAAMGLFGRIVRSTVRPG